MNTNIPGLLLYLFFGMAVIFMASRFLATKEWKSLVLGQIIVGWKPFVLTILPATALLALVKTGDAVSDTAVDSPAFPYFAGAALVSFLVSQIGLNAELRSALLLLLSVGLTLIAPTEFVQPVLGVAGGLLVWKVVENLLHKPDSRLDDITAPIIWLTTFYWSRVGLSGQNSLLCQGVVLATLLVATFIRWLQPLLLSNDPVYVKRVMLSITGGLAMLLLVSKVLLRAGFDTTAILAGAGFLFTYLLQSFDRSSNEGADIARPLRNILLVGIMTLAATRLFGMQGLMVVAAATTISAQPGAAFIAGLFFVSRVLLQAYEVQYNTNISGINLMHNYSSAALYAGFLLPIGASLLIRDVRNRKLLLVAYLTSMVIVPAASTYFLHAEPTASLLVSAGVASVLITLLAPALYPAYSGDQKNVILMPALVTIAALLCHRLLDQGDNASTQDRLIAIAVAAGVILALSVLNRFIRSSTGKAETQPL